MSIVQFMAPWVKNSGGRDSYHENVPLYTGEFSSCAICAHIRFIGKWVYSDSNFPKVAFTTSMKKFIITQLLNLPISDKEEMGESKMGGGRERICPV